MKTKKLITSLSICTMLLTSAWPLTADAATLSKTINQTTLSKTSASIEIWVVTASSLNTRSGPGTSYPIIGSIKKGTFVETDKKSGNWYRLTPEFGSGWVSGSYLEPWG